MNPLTSAHIEAERRLRDATTTAVERTWRNLPSYDRANVDQWLSLVVPVVETAQRRSISLTDAYIARFLRRPPVGIDADELIRGLRNGTPTPDVYERPFVTLWTALKNGTAYEDALHAALARAQASAAMDVQMAMRGAADAFQRAEPGFYGFKRVADAIACDFCRLVDGAYVKRADAMALHNHCGCGLEPLTEPHPLASTLPNGVSVRSHGELGPVLTDPAHDFTQGDFA